MTKTGCEYRFSSIDQLRNFINFYRFTERFSDIDCYGMSTLGFRGFLPLVKVLFFGFVTDRILTQSSVNSSYKFSSDNWKYFH